MQIWIDNTGLHAAGKCLLREISTDSEASGHYDVRGLLHLATLIIFADRLALNGFEHDNIASASSEYRSEIVSLGLEPQALTIKNVSRDDYALACKSAADYVALELPVRYQPKEHQLLGLKPPDLPRAAVQRIGNFISLTTLDQDSHVLVDIRTRALDEKAIAAVEYMLAISPELRVAIADLVERTSSWNVNDSYQLSAFLRYNLNDSLAQQISAIYAPAVGRAELIDRQSQFVLELLEDSVTSIVNEIRAKPLGIPGVAAALVKKSKGDPKGVLLEAIAMRPRATKLRKCLSAYARNIKQKPFEGDYDITEKIKELGQQLRFSLKLDPPPRFVDAVDFQFVLGLPTVSVSGGKFIDWLRHRRWHRKLAFLTEIAKTAKYFDVGNDDFLRLAQNCRAKK